MVRVPYIVPRSSVRYDSSVRKGFGLWYPVLIDPGSCWMLRAVCLRTVEWGRQANEKIEQLWQKRRDVTPCIQLGAKPGNASPSLLYNRNLVRFSSWKGVAKDERGERGRGPSFETFDDTMPRKFIKSDWMMESKVSREEIKFFFASFLLRLSFVSWFFRGESKRDAWVIADRDSSIGSLCWYASTRSTNAPSLFAHWANKQKTVKNKRGNRRGNKCIKEEACCPHYQMSWRRTGVGSRKSGGVSWRIRKHTRLHYRVSISSSIICCRFFSPLLHPSNCNLAHDDWRGHWTRKKRYRRVNVWTTKVQTKSTNCFWLLLCLFPSPSATNDGYDTHDRTTK